MKTPLFALAVIAHVVLMPERLRAQSSSEQLTQAEVAQIIAQAGTVAMWMDPGAIIAVTDREGFVLGVWDMQGLIQSPLPTFVTPDDAAVLRTYGLFAGAITRAGTAAFLSSDQEAFTSRTAGYIIQQHFAPGVANTAPGPLVGVGFSNLFFSDINRLKKIANPLVPGAPFDPLDLRASLAPGDLRRISPGVRGTPIIPGSLTDSPGGVPLYKNGHLVGGLGVTGDGTPTNLATAAAIFLSETQLYSTPGFVANAVLDADEQVALAGQRGFRPAPGIVATNVLINGIRIPYVWQPVENVADASGFVPLANLPGRIVDGFPIQAPPSPYPYPVTQLGGIAGELRGPVTAQSAADHGGTINFIDDPISTVPGRQLIGTASRLTAAEVQQIITAAAQRASITRAGIRLPLGTSAKVFIAVVNNPNKDLDTPAVLGTFRVGEATMFSWDVAVQKARTALFFSNSQLAMSTRTVGFLAQSHFPPGIEGTPYGPLFGFQEAVTLKRRAVTGEFPGNPNLPNGITIFPGGFPLYRNGELVGAIGVSGDGVDQDDIISASGCANFLANQNIRADTFSYGGARLPYAKFPRDPVISVDAAVAPQPAPTAPAGTVSSAVRSPWKNTGDLNGDGAADLVFQNSAGQIASWFLNGSGDTINFTTGAGMRPGSKMIYSGVLGDWKIVGVGDLNGDGTADLVFQNGIGQIAIWFLNGSGDAVNFATGAGIRPGSRLIYSGGLGDWKIAGIGDLNGDGFADLVFQNAAGQIAVWYLNGSGVTTSGGYLCSASLGDWKIVAVGDLNGDGIADLVFQNAAGNIGVWFLDGSANPVDLATGTGLKPGSKFMYTGGLGDWKIVGVRDLNGDGMADMIFQNGTGQIKAWFLDGSTNTVDLISGSGLKSPGSKFIYTGNLGDWRLR